MKTPIFKKLVPLLLLLKVSQGYAFKISPSYDSNKFISYKEINNEYYVTMDGEGVDFRVLDSAKFDWEKEKIVSLGFDLTLDNEKKTMCITTKINGSEIVPIFQPCNDSLPSQRWFFSSNPTHDGFQISNTKNDRISYDLRDGESDIFVLLPSDSQSYYQDFIIQKKESLEAYNHSFDNVKEHYNLTPYDFIKKYEHKPLLVKKNKYDEERYTYCGHQFCTNSKGNGIFHHNSFISSRNGQFILILEDDGHLCAYKLNESIDGKELYFAEGSKNTNFLCVQTDRNVVLYDEQSKPLWDSCSWLPEHNFQYALDINNEGEIAIVDLNYAPGSQPNKIKITSYNDFENIKEKIVRLQDKLNSIRKLIPLHNQRINQLKNRNFHVTPHTYPALKLNLVV